MRKHLLLIVAILCMSVQNRAADFKTGGSVTINTAQHGDLYIFAGTVIVNAPVYGDIIISGGNVTINDSISEDVLVAGGKVQLNGYVGDDVRCAGGQVKIAGYINGDLVVAGGVVNIEPLASASSIAATGGTVNLAGTSRSSLSVAAGNFTLTGRVDGNADCKGSNIVLKGAINGKARLAASEDIIVDSKAHIGRGIQYWLPFKRALKIPAGVAEATPVYDPLLSITHERWYFLGASTFIGLLWYLGMAFVLILILQYLFSTTFYVSGIKIQARPVRSFFIGLAYFISVPIAAVILLATIIGVPLSILLSAFYITTLLMATIISSVVIVNWFSFMGERTYTTMKMAGMELIAFALLKVVTFTPFFGWLLMIAISATSFGAIITSIRWKLKAGERNSKLLDLPAKKAARTS